MKAAPTQIWWTAAELADAGLPDMPGTKRGVNDLVNRLGWSADRQHARRRAGKGGGWEYHWTLLPSRAQRKLIADAAPTVPDAPVPATVDRDTAWDWYEGLPSGPKEKAAARLATIQKVEAMEAGGLTRYLAVNDAAVMDGVSPRSVWNWLDLISGIAPADRLPYLAPRHRAVTKAKSGTAVDLEFMGLILKDWLRYEQPSLTSVYDRACRIAVARGIPVAPIHSVRRWIDRNVSVTVQVMSRKGSEAFKRMYPPQVRDKSTLHAMEAVNGDFHRFDVFVRFPATADGQKEEIARPQMCAFQDIYSGKLVSWLVDRTPNSHVVQLCVGQMIEKFGIPRKVLLDNGREFASKAITGGARTRFRFKVREEDIPGLLTSLGCDIVWALPYSGQSKPIERAFRDLCDRVSKHPAFEGAYTGNSPTAKPENYGKAAIPLAAFLAVLNDEIALHNARQDRRSEVAYGRSFDEVFEESYATAKIRKATPAQRRLWLMGAEGVRANSTNGQVRFMGNSYWADWMHTLCGKKIVARFDRSALWDGLHVYSMADEYLGFAPCIGKTGFFDAGDFRAHNRNRTAYAKAVKAERDALKKLTGYDVAAELADLRPVPPEPVEAKVIEPLFERPKATLPAPPRDAVAASEADWETRIVTDLDQRRQKARTAQAEDDDRDLYIRARQLEADMASGAPLTKDQHVWLAGYQRTAGYRQMKAMVEEYGEIALAK
jgi:putative transposase